MRRKTEKERETSWAPLFQLPKIFLLQEIMGNRVVVVFSVSQICQAVSHLTLFLP